MWVRDASAFGDPEPTCRSQKPRERPKLTAARLVLTTMSNGIVP